jgi:hypothetical protein
MKRRLVNPRKVNRLVRPVPDLTLFAEFRSGGTGIRAAGLPQSRKRTAVHGVTAATE